MPSNLVHEHKANCNSTKMMALIDIETGKTPDRETPWGQRMSGF
jgi:hypothetical protein